MASRQYADTDVDALAKILFAAHMPECPWDRMVAEAPYAAEHWRFEARKLLPALTAAGWEARCDCDGVVHDLPILRAHLRGEPGCEAARLVPEEVATGEPAGATVFALPPEPPVGTRLWEVATGREWVRKGSQDFAWRLAEDTGISDPRHVACTWTGVLKHGPLSTSPPDPATDPGTPGDAPRATVPTDEGSRQ